MSVEAAPFFAPWFVNEQDDDIAVHDSNPVRRPGLPRVCTLPLGDEGMARARLIGSAPVLAKALGTAVLALRSYENGNGSREFARDMADACEEMLRGAGFNGALDAAGGPL